MQLGGLGKPCKLRLHQRVRAEPGEKILVHSELKKNLLSAVWNMAYFSDRECEEHTLHTLYIYATGGRTVRATSHFN